MSTYIADELSKQTKELVSRFEVRANSFAGRADLTRITNSVDVPAATSFARAYFGAGEHTATGIDGSMDFDERLQMMLFYSNATGYSCPFKVGSDVKFELDAARRESKLAASAAIPLWAEDLGSVFSSQPEVDIDLEHSMERIPNSFMTLGELYLAYLVCGQSRIVFLDRLLSGTHSTLSRDARNLLKRGESKLIGWSSTKVTMQDLFLGISLGAPGRPIPKRTRFLTLAVLKSLMKAQSTVSGLAEELHVPESAVEKSWKRLSSLDERWGGVLLEGRTGSRLSLRQDVPGYWGRVTELANSYSRAVFEQRMHPLALRNDEYLNILDVSTVSLIMLEMLQEKAAATKSLLVGIAKDTTATDVTRAVLPYASSKGLLKLESPPPKLRNDRAFLAILSSENPSMKTPWRTMGYDSAFSTIIESGGEFYSARKVVGREGLYVRAFFQLRSLRSDPAIRSQVFLFDRLFEEGADVSGVRSVEVKERTGLAAINPYLEGRDFSDVSNAVLHLLSLADNPEVFEAFGHNQLLYLADKAVKAEVKMLRSSLRGVADLRVGSVSSRKKIFGLVSSYREQRAEAEHGRTRRGGLR